MTSPASFETVEFGIKPSPILCQPDETKFKRAGYYINTDLSRVIEVTVNCDERHKPKCSQELRIVQLVSRIYDFFESSLVADNERGTLDL